MAFESVNIQSTRNGVSLVVGEREDLAAADVVVLSLNSTLGITSVRWSIIGRPEGSTAGGAGPEPILLATAPTSSFTVDADALPVHLDGSYIVEALINPGSPGEVRKTVLLARMAGITIPKLGGGVRSLRKLGGFESLEDTSVPTILQGWKTQLNRWLDLVQAIAVGGGVTVTLAGAYGTGTTPTDQTLAITDARGGGLVIDASSGSFTGQSALRVNTAAGGPLVVDRATGNLGIGIAVPLSEIHVRSATPGIRLDSSAGGGQAFEIENIANVLTVTNRTTSNVLAVIPGTGGVRSDFGLAVGVAPAGGVAVAFGDGSATTLSTAGNARLIYNAGARQLQVSAHGGPYLPIGSQVVEVDGIATGSAQLSALTPPLSGAYFAWVRSVRRMYRLDRLCTLTADEISIVTALGGGRWIAMSELKDPTNIAQSTFYWDPSNISTLASDENTGLTALDPLRTHDEIDRRIGGSMPLNGPTIFVMSDIPSTQRWRISNAQTFSNGGGGFISYQGLPTVITAPPGTGTITAVVAPDKSAGVDQWWEITDATLPASWTAAGYVDNWIVVKSGSTVVASGPIIHDFGGATKRCRVGALGKTGPTLSSINSTRGTISNGNTYQVFRLPQAGPPYEIVDPYSSVEFFALDFQSLNFECSTLNFIHRAFCTFRSYGKLATGIDEQIFVVGALNATVLNGRDGDLKASTWKDSFLAVEAEGFAASSGSDLIFQDSVMVVESSASVRIDADVGFLDCISGSGPFGFLRMISIQNNSKAFFRGRVWGRGNTMTAVHVEDPACWMIYNGATPPQVQTSGTKIELGTRTFSFSDLIENGGTGVVFPDKNTGVTSGVV